MSKREGDFSVRELRAVGYLPEALLNYLARLGHRYEHDEWMEPAELAAGFAVAHLGRAPAHYDEAQLLHWQTEAVGRAAPERLWTWMGSMVHERVPPDRREEFIARCINTRFPADAVFWANRLFGGDWTPSDDSRTAIAAAGRRFAQALAAYAEYGAVYRPLVEDLKQRTGAKGERPVHAATGGADGRDPWSRIGTGFGPAAA